MEDGRERCGNRCYVQSARKTRVTEKPFSYTNRYGYVSRLQQEGVAPMFLTDPLWLTALATLVTSIASLVWALRRKR